MIPASVFLTGATGTVGSGILEILSRAGYEVHCLVRHAGDAPAIRQLGGHVIVGDMTDPTLFRRLAAERKFNYLIHAAQAHYRDYPAAEINRQEKSAVQNLEILRSADTRLMVFTCGVWVYQNHFGNSLISEATPFAPQPEAALRVELMAALSAVPDSRWAQFCLPSFVYGSRGPLPDLAGRLAQGDIELSADASAQWSVIERLDLGRAYLALLQNGKPRDYFVVAEDAPVGVVALHEAIARHVNAGRVLLRAEARPVHSHPVNPARFKAETGWTAHESCLESFARFLPR